MTEIRVLGALEVLGSDGKMLDALLAQPKRTAVLAFLALTSRGELARRDSVIGMFWPEHSDDRARASLRQALYALRQDLGEQTIVTRGDDEVGLNTELIRCDAVVFEEALSRGDLLEAAELYRGPFLSGFYLKGCAEFGQWVDTERDRLARVYTRALEDLADQAALDNDMPMVVEWCRRLSTHNPYSTRVAIRYMKALEAAGDRAGALAFADRHATLMHADLEAAPSPDVVKYAERLRHRPAGRAASEVSKAAGGNDASISVPRPVVPTPSLLLSGTDDLRLLALRWKRIAFVASGIAGAFAIIAIWALMR